MKKKVINTLFSISFVFYIIFLLWSILFKYVSPIALFSDERYFSRSLNLIPFNDIICGNYNSLDIWGNIVLFIPLGIYICTFFKNSNPLRNILRLSIISFTLESLQYILAIGASDITDIITNTSGGILGIFIYMIMKGIFKDDNKVKNFISVCSTLVLIPVVFIIILLMISN